MKQPKGKKDVLPAQEIEQAKQPIREIHLLIRVIRDSKGKRDVFESET